MPRIQNTKNTTNDKIIQNAKTYTKTAKNAKEAPKYVKYQKH